MITMAKAKAPTYRKHRIASYADITTVSANKLLKAEVDRLFGKNSRIERKIRRKNHIILDNYVGILCIYLDQDYASYDPNIDLNDFKIELAYQINKDDISFQYQGGNNLNYLEALEKTQYFSQIDEISSQDSFKVSLKEFKTVLKVLAEEFLFFANYANDLNLYLPEIDNRDPYQEMIEEKCYA